MIPIQQAFELLDGAVKPLPSHTVAVADALHCVLESPVYAQTDLPPFTQTAVDGYAVRHVDLAGDKALKVVGEVAAGAVDPIPQLAAGSACRIFTGGYLPEGADTVLRQEIVQRNGSQIQPLQRVQKGADIRYRGEELKAGDALMDSGFTLSAARLASLSMAGVSKVSVYRLPKIAVLITGNEVTAPGKPLLPGQVYDANGISAANFLRRAGYSVTLEYLSDDLSQVTAAIDQAFASHDVVITTGGVSVGDHDYIPAASDALGGKTLFWKVAQMPGKPLFCAQHTRGWLMGLPGNPAAVVVNLHTFVSRLLQLLQGIRQNLVPNLAPGLVINEMPRNPRRARWQRVVQSVDSEGRVCLASLPKQASHMLSNTAAANALALISAGETAVLKGEMLSWLPLQS